MSFVEAVKSVFRQYVGFSGRARRSEYWWFTLFAALVTLVPYTAGFAALAASASNDPEGQPDPAAAVPFLLVGLIGLALLLPSLAVSVRRLHDVGRSGWWYLLSFVPFGGIVVLVFAVMDSEPGATQYGPNPKGADAVQDGAYGGAYGYAPPQG